MSVRHPLPATYIPNISYLDQVLKTDQYCITFYTVLIRECGVYLFFYFATIFFTNYPIFKNYFFRLAKMGRHNRTRPWSAHESRLQADPIFHMRKKHWEGLIQVI